MNEFLFTHGSIHSLALLLLNLVILGYLLSVRGKSRATWWLTATFAGISVSWLGAFLRAALLSTVTMETNLGAVTTLGMSLFAWSYLHFAYTFLENPFVREARIALVVTGLFLAVGIGDAAAWIVTKSSAFGFLYAVSMVFGFLVWTTVVLLRKWHRAAREAGSTQASRPAGAYRAYTLLNGLMLASVFIMVLQETGAIPRIGQRLVSLTAIGFFFGTAVVYLNHAPEPTSFQAKLIGLSLVIVLALIPVTLGIYEAGREDGAALVLEREAVRFSPDGGGGYEATALPYSPEGLEAPGEALNLQGDGATATTVPLGFAFPYYGTAQETVNVAEVPLVFFGARSGGDFERDVVDPYTTDRPAIIPLLVVLDLDAGGGVYLRREPERVVISWLDVPLLRSDRRVTLRLVLHREGTIDFIYDQGGLPKNRVTLGWNVRGLTPGGTDYERRVAPLDEGLPYRIAPGTARFDLLGYALRQQEHARVKPVIWLVFAALAFVLVLFPFFFRSSLVKPLERLLAGVHRVNAGDLEAEVPVGVRDEIGALSLNFNRMTASLRRAEQELRAYAGHLEERVAERTAALNQSLEDLKAMQQQLVHAEKMASLGSLTAGIAHEIKNPLNFINNFAEVNEELADEIHQAVLNGEDLAELLADLKENARVIAQHGRRADGIVRSMMDHASGGSGRRETVSLNALVDEYVELAYHGRRAQAPGFAVAVERALEAEVGEVEVVPQEVGRVLLNLLSNAFDAVQARASSENGAYVPRVVVSARRVEGGAEVRVEDNGPGIPAVVRGKIFEPFYTTKPAGSGTGLGLSLSHEIVVQGHGGMLTVESEPGQGTTFIITLPV